MDKWHIKGYTLEFEESSHTYLVDGVIVPSVTQMMRVRFGRKYDGISESILQKAADRGTRIHKAIEDFCKGVESKREIEEVRNFAFLKKYYDFDVLENETPIILFEGGIPVGAGRLDLVLDFKGYKSIADIKTTAVLDKEYLTYQLNLYRLGYMQSYGGSINQLYGIHLKEHKRKLVNIPLKEEVAKEIISLNGGGADE